MNRYFHGTSYENAMLILEHGFSNNFKNWNESKDDVVYFWDVNEHRDAEKCMSDAYRSACISSAIRNSRSINTAIIEICGDIPTYEDDSCFIAEWERRVCVLTSELNNAISNKLVTIRLHMKEYKPELRACYLYNAYHNCCGIKWDSICNNIIDMESLIKELEKLENVYPYEYHFPEIYN